jgi:hypothetical protein
MTPCRVRDTRTGNNEGTISAQSALHIDVSDACGVPSNATALVLNVTAVPKGPLGFVTIWPAGIVRPTVSTPPI